MRMVDFMYVIIYMAIGMLPEITTEKCIRRKFLTTCYLAAFRPCGKGRGEPTPGANKDYENI